METSHQIRILIVEDAWQIARFLQIELEHEGYSAFIETNGQRGLERIVQENFDLVLLDIMLPELSGREICRKVREISNIPIIMVTACDQLDDKVAGLDEGADDYITKPFATPELFARIRALLRKHQSISDSPSPCRLHHKSLTLYPERYEVTIHQQPVELTRKEYQLFEYMLRNKNIVLTRERILQEVWGYDYAGDTNVVDVYIRYLRSKLDEPAKEKYIHTVRGVGYVVKN